MKAAVINHLLRGRRTRVKRLVLAGSILALLIVVLIVVGTVILGDTTEMAPPAGYSADQLIFDDQFSGTSLNSAHWNTAMSGQGDGRPGTPLASLRVTQQPGPSLIRPIFSPSQVTVNNGLSLTMVPDTKYSSLGYGYRSGVVTTYDKFTLRSG